MATILLVLLLFLHGLLAICVGYLLILTAAAWQAPRTSLVVPPASRKRFVILIPAHNEERLLPSCLESIQQLDYPEELVTVHVVADNCTDGTAGVAQQIGGKVHLRNDPHLRGKGYALQWLCERLRQSGEPYDAAIILDADSTISPNFLNAMANRLERGERAIQVYYTVRSPIRGWAGSLRYAALSVLHYLRPQGRGALGGSAGLKGNGMVFSADLLTRHTWSASVTEDIEFHMALLLDGERVTFSPEAVVWGEMPDTLENSRPQLTRWEQGRLEMARKYVPILLKAAWKAARSGRFQRAYVLVDAVLEHLIPPFSLLLGLCLALWALDVSVLLVVERSLFNLGLAPAAASQALARINLLVGSGLLLGQAVYLFSGLVMVNAPIDIYRSLVYAPGFMVWKIVQYLGVLLGPKKQGWVRTTRNEN